MMKFIKPFWSVGTTPIAPTPAEEPKPESKPTLYCSFCGKSQHDVAKLIAGPAAFICDGCVDVCRDIIAEEEKRPALTPRQEAQVRKIIAGVLLNGVASVSAPSDRTEETRATA